MDNPKEQGPVSNTDAMNFIKRVFPNDLAKDVVIEKITQTGPQRYVVVFTFTINGKTRKYQFTLNQNTVNTQPKM